MPRNRTWALLAAIAVAILSFSVYALREREPVYNGKGVSTWFKEYVELQEDIARTNGVIAAHEADLEYYRQVFRKFGTSAVDYLEQIIQGKKSLLVRFYQLFYQIVPGARQFLPSPGGPLETKLQAAELLLSLQKDPRQGFIESMMALPWGDDKAFVFSLLHLFNSGSNSPPTTPSPTEPAK